jgi:hypothetical protein
MKTKLKIMTGLGVAALAAGCGSSGDSISTITPMPVTIPVDAFTQGVQNIVLASSETASPLDIDGVAVVDSDYALPVEL